MMTRRMLLALVGLACMGCIDTPREKPLARVPSLYKRIGGAVGIQRISDAAVVELLVSDNVTREMKERYAGAQRAAEQKKLTTALTVFVVEGVPLGLRPDAEGVAMQVAIKRALRACKIAQRDEGELLKALEPPPA